MMKRRNMGRRIISIGVLILLLFQLAACENGKAKLSPKHPVTITIWNYYNGSIAIAFDALVKEFNATVGAKEGIVIESRSMGSVTELEKEILRCVGGEDGSMPLPNIFAAYADIVHMMEKMNLFVDFNQYFNESEQAQYLDSFMEEGRIGLSGELRIFPIAKATEVLMLNETDWRPFADATGKTYDDLATMEGLAQVAEAYYQWTDGQTEEPNGGKAFFGRDSLANFFIIASRQFGTELFEVKGGAAEVQINEAVFRKIWDCYYVPYISGCYYASGKFRSDDAKVGNILAYVGSTSSATYFPSEVTINSQQHEVSAKILPTPLFEGGESVIVQQGAGMVVTKGTPEQEHASAVFLKWFTDEKVNLGFSTSTGYMPVKKDALDHDRVLSWLNEGEHSIPKLVTETLKVALQEIETSEMYTSKAFSGGIEVRDILELSLQELANTDRAAVLAMMEMGITREFAVAEFNTEERFKEWVRTLEEALIEVAV